MKKIHLSWSQIKIACLNLSNQILDSAWRPDYIVGISRGGLIPATMLSHYLHVPMKPLMVSFRDNGECVSDLGMAEDAFGVDPNTKEYNPSYKKNILIIDDINDTGSTIEWIKNDWPLGCFPTHNSWKNNIWHHNVRFATIVNNISSSQIVDLSTKEINKSKEDLWVVFPWEEWWSNKNGFGIE
jgi:uncharacterized protein